LNADTPKQVVGYSEDPDHNFKGVLRFFLKNPFWETPQKRVSTETYKEVLSSSTLVTAFEGLNKGHTSKVLEGR
jgi:hypothetical protein